MKVRSILVGLVLGLGIAVPVYHFYADFVLENAVQTGLLLIYAAASFIIILVALQSYVNRLLKRRFGVEQYDAAAIAKQINEAIWDALTFKKEDARRSTETLLVQTASIVSTSIFYRWAFGLFISIIVAVGGTLGTIVLVKQNEKLDEQTREMRKQGAIASSTFLRAKTEEISNILAEITSIKHTLTTADIESISAIYGSLGAKSPCISNAIQKSAAHSPDWRFNIERIAIDVDAALKGAEQSDHYDNVRGWLLRTLSISDIPFSVFSSHTFAGIDISNTNMVGGNLDNARLMRASLFNANLQRLCAANLILRDANGQGVNFEASMLINPSFEGADLSRSSFVGANISRTDYNSGAFYIYDYVDTTYEADGIIQIATRKLKNLWNNILSLIGYRSSGGYVDIWVDDGVVYSPSAFTRSNLRNANFSRAKLDFVTFESADLTNSSFRNAVLTKNNSFKTANMSGVDFRLEKSSFASLEVSDFSEAKFVGAALDGLDFGNNKSVTKDQLKAACICNGPHPKLQGEVVELGHCPRVGGQSVCGSDPARFP